jgi:hypothetical protein
VALPHHDASHRNEGARGETKLFRTEESGDLFKCMCVCVRVSL